MMTETKEQYESRMLGPDLCLRGKATDHIWLMEDVEGYIGIRMDCGDSGTVYLTHEQARDLAQQVMSLQPSSPRKVGEDGALREALEWIASSDSKSVAECRAKAIEALSLSSPIEPPFTCAKCKRPCVFRPIMEDGEQITSKLVCLACDWPTPQASSEVREALERIEALSRWKFRGLSFVRLSQVQEALAPSRQVAGGTLVIKENK